LRSRISAIGNIFRRRTAAPAVYATVGVVLVLAASAFAYDTARDDLIAPGVRVAGVNVGGMRSSEARRKLEAELAARLERPVVVRVVGRRFRLTAAKVGLAVDADGMTRSAVDSSRSGWLATRVWRGLTGHHVNTDLPAQVDYSGVAVRRFVKRVARAINRPPRDASVEFKLASLPAVPSQTGLRLRRLALRRSVELALSRPTGRGVRGHVRVLKPKVTTGRLAKKYPEVITVDRPHFVLRFFNRLRLRKTYKIAVGQAGLETPAGLYHIQDKAVNPTWHVPDSAWAGDLAGKSIPPGPENPIKARWMGIYAGAGIHGTTELASLGTAASHGCIRMAIPDVEELFDKVPLQTPVFIQ
jgi:hypothetical protein